MDLIELDDFHWLMDILQTIDVGLVVIDRQYEIQLWNGFMENHSGQLASHIRGQNLLTQFPDLPVSWLQRKVEEVFALHSPVFSSWEQRPRLFDFSSTRPFTGNSALMYQNITLMPLVSRHGSCNHICIIIYDVTDAATGKQGLQEANHQLKALSITDRLTGLYNRGHWEECMRHEYQRHFRSGCPVTLLMFDIDFFKKINDTYGHPAGDAVLRQVSVVLKQQLRSTDIAGRYGGEEFGVLLLDADSQTSWNIAERLRQAIAHHQVTHDGRVIEFTISIGLAVLDASMPTPAAWLVQTDNALYHSKHTGRNRVTLAGTHEATQDPQLAAAVVPQ